MSLPNFKKSYELLTQSLLQKHDQQTAMSLAVGGDFQAVGQLEYALLRHCGLEKHHTVIDVGCGSGRLAVQLRDFLDGKYIGLDVVKDLFVYAQEISQRPDWSFYEAPGLSIPEPDNSADFICFLSVFTHLLHEESYQYLQDAARVIKPGGRIIVSFLEFKHPSHLLVFHHRCMTPPSEEKVLSQFMSRDGLEAWASHLGLDIVAIYEGEQPIIKLEEPIKFEDGREMVNYGNFWQSVCIFTKA